MFKIPPQFQIAVAPLADSLAVVTAAQARFTVLTSRLIRLEWDSQERFEDRPSQVFWYRRQAVPDFSVRQSESNLEIETEHLLVHYQFGEGFTPQSLLVKVYDTGQTWHYGDADPGNLLGTARTLDKVWGTTPLEPGLLSRSGWVVIDDSRSLVFNEQGWIEARRNPDALDLYFLGYGHAYSDCLADFNRLSGRVPLIPRWVLGNWWSRFWEYTQDELTALMQDFQSHQVPLAVCIVDMNWHLQGWTGYTWNRGLFPDPEEFIRFLHQIGLKTALNLHPAEGVGPHEAMYPQMAEVLGRDPASQENIAFDMEDPQFVNAYFEVLHHPQEEMGVDFWWIDWQQGNPCRLPGLNLLWWINHLHFYDSGRVRAAGAPPCRPFIFSRWGGLGNHRYPIGFSGDTVVAWESLAFQPYFTSTAANVNYGWWSHDIGGHMQGIEDAELYSRWVQSGVFSPILRLHSTKNAFQERRPWGYDAETFQITRQALQLRHALIPYLYTMAWRDHQEGKALSRPMYHTNPETAEAYACPAQYWFGSELIAAPFTSPRDADTRLSRQVIWLPGPEPWFNFFTGQMVPAGWHAVYGNLDDIPVFAKAGAIVPLGKYPAWDGLENPNELTVHIFPGANNRFTLFEDDGKTQLYLNGDFALTSFELQSQPNRLEFKIEAVRGARRHIPAERAFNLVFHAIHQPVEVSIELDGQRVPTPPVYDQLGHTLTFSRIQVAPEQDLIVRLEENRHSLVNQEENLAGSLVKMVKAFRLGSMVKSALADRLTEILADPNVLADFDASLARSQLRALLEIILDAGIDQNYSSGESRIAIWNNHTAGKVTYQVSTEQLHLWNYKQRFSSKRGKAPVSEVHWPGREFPGLPVVWQLNYGDLLKVVLDQKILEPYSRPSPGVF